MSWPAMAWALAQKTKAPDKLVLLLLAYRTNPDTETADPSIDHLAAECGMSRSGVKLVLQRLVDRGLVHSQERKGEDGKNLPNRYRLIYEGGRGHDVTPTGHDVTGGRGHDVTTRAGSLNGGGSSAGARFDFSTWPNPPTPEALKGWLDVRTRKRAPTDQATVERMGRELHLAAQIGWTVDEVLAECHWKGWQGMRADWLEPKTKNPLPGGAGGNGGPHRGRSDYAQAGRGSNASRGGSAIDRVLGNAQGRAAREPAADRGPGPDRGDDDLGLRDPVDVGARR